MKNLTHLDQVFKNKSKKSNLFRVSHGAQMGNFGGPYLWVFVLTLVLFTVVAFMMKEWMTAFILIVINFFLANYIIDFRGFEIDISNRKIRNYKSFLGIRRGKWMNLDDFDSIKIKRDKILEARSDYSDHIKSHDTHHFYFIHLIPRNEKQVIVLGERNNFSKAKVYAQKIEKYTGVKFE